MSMISTATAAMRLVRVGPAGHEVPAVLDAAGRVLDAQAHVRDYDREFFASGSMDRLRQLVADGELPEHDGGVERFGPCVARPEKIVCVGLNYREHAREAGMEVPTEPVLFLKAPNAMSGPDDPIYLPVGGDKTDWEIELAVIIGAQARYLADEEAAMAVIAGYAIANDVSERAFQLERAGQWVKGKSCETFNPLGPWVLPAADVPDVQALRLELSVNGDRKQSGTTADMVFPVSHIVWYISQFMVLEPGDVVNTGTPWGVGMGLEPQQFLRCGDVLELQIDGLGRQRQEVVEAPR